MKVFSSLLIIALLTVGLGCTEKCDPEKDEVFGDEFFTVTYVDANGNNLLETGGWNPANVQVFLDTSGGTDRFPDLENLFPVVQDGKFGPFSYVERYIDPRTEEPNGSIFYNIPFNFDYYIRKDFAGVDTLRVSFLADAGVCNVSWSHISFYLNGDLLPEYEDQQQADIVIVE